MPASRRQKAPKRPSIHLQHAQDIVVHRVMCTPDASRVAPCVKQIFNDTSHVLPEASRRPEISAIGTVIVRRRLSFPLLLDQP